MDQLLFFGVARGGGRMGASIYDQILEANVTQSLEN